MTRPMKAPAAMARIAPWAVAVRAVVALAATGIVGTAGAQSAPGAGAAPFADGRGTVTAEVLYAWFKASPTPVPLITDNTYGLPATNVLLGGGTIDTNPNAGFRVTGTYALPGAWGLEGTGFYVPSRSTSRSVSSSGAIDSTDLLLPFFDVTQGRENFTEVSFSPIFSGRAETTLTNNLGGGELNATWSMPSRDGWKLNLLGGFRYLQLREKYTFTTSSPDLPPGPTDIWDTTDQFDATNRFYGLQVGARAAFDQGAWVGSGFAKLALGTMQQSVSISGSLQTNDFNDLGPVQTFAGGYFALPSNIGEHSRNQFAVVPEIGLALGYRVTPAATILVSYSLLYASDVVRPGLQVNRNVNPTQSLAYGGEPPARLVGAAQPSFGFDTTDFWAQTLSIGLAYRF
jgi:hypothetical protein